MASRYLALKQREHDIAAEAGKLDLETPEGVARLDALQAEKQEISAALLVEEKRRELERTAPAAVSQGVTVHSRAIDKPWGYDTAPQSPQSVALGEFLQAVHRSATGQGTDERLLIGAAAQGMGAAVGADGGFLVGQSVSDRVMLRVMGGQIMSRISPIPLEAGTDSIALNVVNETSRATGSRFGGVQGYWIDEGTAPTASRPRLAKVELKLRGLAALGYATNELLRNAAALDSVMTRAFGEELKFLAENAIFRGSGAGQPLGLLNAPALITVPAEVGQGAATIVKENVDKMWARMYAPARQNAIWLINQDIEPQLDDLQMGVGVGGVPVYLPPGGLSETPHARLKGRPVIPVEYASTLGAVGDIVLTSFDDYLAIQEAVQQASSMHVAFTTNEMAFRAVMYVDGQHAWRSALTPFQGTNTLSPIVTLAAR